MDDRHDTGEPRSTDDVVEREHAPVPVDNPVISAPPIVDDDHDDDDVVQRDAPVPPSEPLEIDSDDD